MRLALTAFAALAIVTLPASALLLLAQPAPATYTLTGVTPDGEAYDLDTGQTFNDCERATYDYDMRYTLKLCVREQ